MESTTITLPLSPTLFWGCVTLAGIALASWVVAILLPNERDNPVAALQDRLGLQALPIPAFLTFSALWCAIALVLFAGLFGLILDVLDDIAPDPDSDREVWDFRFKLIQITALTTVLGAVIALPITVSRLRLTQKQTDTADAALFNEKINAATAGLYARRQVTTAVAPGGTYRLHQDFWQDDIAQRNAAIDRLEGLARENPDDTRRIARLLSVYVRELSADVRPAPAPKDATPDALKDWADALPPLRSDMEKAAQTLGRLHAVAPEPLADDIDLRGVNLQKADLKGLHFEKALFTGAQLQGANLWKAHLQGANLWKARLQGTKLEEAMLHGANLSHARLQIAKLKDAQLQGANLSYARLQAANLKDAQFQGANLKYARLQAAYLWSAHFDLETLLDNAYFSSAAVRETNLTNAPQIRDHIPEIFGDASVTLPEGISPPTHWSPERPSHQQFHADWRKWQATLPPGWDNPEE